ncbi:MAG: endonuclease/exonuclease/phosphatase family protein [Deltaproteobacteria bacterium]|nr:endonuclease/exonuclease/phosphatase family protein [Deltaproteobacteria bacterium]
MPGLIMIQIDGLGRTQLEKALKRGRLPSIRRLLRSERVRLYSHYSGVPSTTPAVQAELFYGVKTGVPAFYYLHRKSGQLFSMQFSQAAKAVATELESRTDRPLLQGGHAYADIFTGGAEEARFCAESMDLESLLRRMHPVKWVLLPILYSYKVARVLALALLEIFLALIDFVRGVFDRKDVWYEFLFILSRIGVVIVLREIVRFMVRLDIERGIPVIHANFLGYDEQAHRRGPESYFAHWALKGIDDVVRDILRAIRRSDYRDYEMIIYSDHGQESCRMYVTEHGVSVRQAVRRTLHALWNGGTPPAAGTDWEADNETGLFTRGLLRSKPARPPVRPPDLATRVTVTAKGPLGHVYLPFIPDEAQKQAAAHALVHEAGIPLVLYTLTDGEVRAVNSKGLFRLPQDAAPLIGQDHPFLTTAAEDLAATCRHPDAGDLVISGWEPGARPLTFPVENGAHGGPGKEETHGFVMLPETMPLPETLLGNTQDQVSFLRPLDLRRVILAYLEPLEKDRGTRVKIMDGPRIVASHRVRHPSVMTYNVHSCIGTDGKVRPLRIARLISRLQPDIVAVQELDVACPRTGCIDQAAMIGAELDMAYVFLPLIEGEKGCYGIAIFSRWPFSTVRAEAFHAPSTKGREPRGAVWIKLDLNGETIHIINTHLGLTRRERLAQIQTLLGPNWLGAIENNPPIIVCGDFNARPGSAVYGLVQRVFKDVQTGCAGHIPKATFASYRPFMRIDHIFVSNAFSVERVCVAAGGNALVASDHLPLKAELKFTAQGQKQGGGTHG